MKNSVSILLVIILLAIMILGLTGCWDRRELNTLGILSGIGIDQTDEPDKIQLTAQLLKPSEIGTPQEGGGSDGSPCVNFKGTGDTVFEIIRSLSLESSRKIYFPHNEVIILGRAAAEKGVQRYIDFFVRDPETRRDDWVLVAKSKASDILEIESKMEKIPSNNIVKLIKNKAATSQVSAVNLDDFTTRLMSKTTAPVAALIEISGEGKEKKLRLSGTAVFKEDKLVGQLNNTETRGLLWILNEVESGIIKVACSNNDGKANLEIIQARSKITPQIKNEKIYINIKIEEKGNLGSQTCSENLSTLQAWSFLEKRQAQAIRNEVMAAVKKAQSLNTDIFGFGEAVHRKYPEQWKDIEERWDEFFPDLEVSVTVNAKLQRSGLSTKPPKPE